MQNKKVPMRMCCGCGEMKAKAELIRVVKDDNGVFVDKTSKKNGRGAYLCNNAECLKKAVKSKRIERGLHISIPDEIYQRLKEEIEQP